MKRLMWLFEVYVFQFPLDMLHEFSHWIFVAFTWLGGWNSFPKLVIVRWPSREVMKDHTTQTMSLQAHIAYTTYWGKKGRKRTLHQAICCSMPFCATIALFWVTPYWFWIYILANIGTAMPSESDLYKIKVYFLVPIRAKKIRKIREDRLNHLDKLNNLEVDI